MGKGGEGQQTDDIIIVHNNQQLRLSSSSLEEERALKREQSPQFYWDDEKEPHAIRRKQILAVHPEIKQLMGPDPATKYKVLILVAIQVASVHLLQGASFGLQLFMCYSLSGSINHMLTLAMHEISHNLAFKKPLLNRILALIANMPMGLPAAASFKRYHMEHHKYQGEDVVDVDIPCNAEGWFFTSTPKKILWCLLQPAFYSLRPLFVNPKIPGTWEYINLLTCISFNATIVYFYGFSGLVYLVLGTLFGMGLHPVAGHFIAEHYVMQDGQETYSYYGPLNWLTFNVGYHNEHHDFPFISGKNLPLVRKIAPEFYDDIPHYHSWSKVIYDYCVDTHISPFSRTKRVTLSQAEINEVQARDNKTS